MPRHRNHISWESALCWSCTPHSGWMNPLCSSSTIYACLCPSYYLAGTEYLLNDSLQNRSCCEDTCECVAHPCFTCAVYWSSCWAIYGLNHEGTVTGVPQTAALGACSYYLALCCLGRSVYTLRRQASLRYGIRENFALSILLSVCCWPCTLSQTYQRLEMEEMNRGPHITRPVVRQTMDKGMSPLPSPSPSPLPSPYIPDSDDDTDI